MEPTEKSVWEEKMPKTQKSKNCGLERKSDSRLWKTKVGKKKREGRMERTKCERGVRQERGRKWRPALSSPCGHLVTW